MGKNREGTWEADLFLAEKRGSWNEAEREILLYRVFIVRWTVFAFVHVGFIMAAVKY